MKITKTQLKQIIKEELGRVLEQDAQGYKGYTVQQGAYGSVSFLELEGNPVLFKDPRDGEMEALNSGYLMQFTEKLPGFEDIINVQIYNDLKKGSRFGYPDLDVLVDQGGFKEGMTIQNLLNLYVEEVLNK